MTTIARSEKGSTLHYKDPVAFLQMMEIPTSFLPPSILLVQFKQWVAHKKENQAYFELISENILERGNSWDVACSRVTEKLSVPKIGPFADLPDLSIYFYDGAECLRPLDQNAKAAKRPRGYSCEELGGLAWGKDTEFPKLNKLSIDFPLFISPHGTGCDRYASAVSSQTAQSLRHGNNLRKTNPSLWSEIIYLPKKWKEQLKH